MNLSKMKNTLIALLFLISFNLIAQIPDSLKIDLPWSVIELPICDATMGEGPKAKKGGVLIFLESDVIHSDELDECQFRTKKWQIFDWLGGIAYSYTQVGSLSTLVNTNCENEIYLRADDFPLILTPTDLLLDLDPAHDYSFNFSDPDDEIRMSNFFPEIKSSFELFVYDFTDNSVCRCNVFITDCEEDISITFPETAEVEFNGEPYIELTLEMLGVFIEYPCDSYTTKIKISNQASGILLSSHVGTSVTVTVEVILNDGTKYINEIYLNVTGIKPDPIKMFIEEKSFSAGETISLEVWSEDIPGLVTWGLQMEFIDAEILEIQTSQIFEDIPHNIYNSGLAAKALWVPADGLPIDLESDLTWFTLVVKSNIDGNTLDIFETDLDPWSEIVMEDDDFIFDFPAEFTFVTAPRNVLGIDDEVNFPNIEVFPNPSSHNISITGLPNPDSSSKIEVFNLEGRLLLQKEFTISSSTFTLDISELPTGMFILKAQNGKKLSAHKIYKI